MADDMAISREQVLHVAKLAELDLTESEVERFGEQLNAILEAVGRVSELALADVPPTSHPVAVVNVFGADEPRPCLPLDRRPQVQRGGPVAPRQDEYRRVRDGLVHGELGLWAVEEPVGPLARPWRLGRRERRRRRVGDGSVGAWLRHGRLDQAAVGT